MYDTESSTVRLSVHCHSAATAAVLAVRGGVAVQDVDYAELSALLLEADQRLAVEER